MPVYAGRGEGEVQEVGCKLVLRVGVSGTKATVVGIGAGDDVLDVRVLDAVEPGPGVWAVDAALGVNDAGFNGRRVMVVVWVVFRASVFRAPR